MFDYYASRPFGPLNPFPTHLTIEGDAQWVYDGVYLRVGIFFTFTLTGGEPIGVEDSAVPSIHRVTFSKTLPYPIFLQEPDYNSGCWLLGDDQVHYQLPCEYPMGNSWAGPVLNPLNFGAVQLDFNAGQSSDMTSPDYRGPDYTYAHVTLSVNRIGFYQCKNDTTCDSWRTPTDGRLPGRMAGVDQKAFYSASAMAALEWHHPLYPWVLFVESTERDGACLMKLLCGCAKFDSNYGFAFPSGYQPCLDGTPAAHRSSDLPTTFRSIRQTAKPI